MDNIDLDNFFGYCEVEIECPPNCKYPLLPVKHEGKTIYPRGKWTGTYFSEELKAVIPLGYKVKLLKGIEFTKAYLFKDYVEHFFKIKSNSTGSTKFIAKLMLNCLYGVFGRKQEQLKTVNVPTSQISYYLAHSIVKAIIPISEDISSLLMLDNLDQDLIKDLNKNSSLDLWNTKGQIVKSNVAIAAAITAYARIHMMQFKLNGLIAYSDTDSVFTTVKLALKFVGDKLGLMKDEMNGILIEEAIFIGPKQYGYWFIDANGVRVERSTFSGVPKNSLTFSEVEQIFNGSHITKDIPVRFNRSFTELSVTIKPAKITISAHNIKKLIDNKYEPVTINKSSVVVRVIKLLKEIRYLQFIARSYQKLQKIATSVLSSQVGGGKGSNK
ncbi:hypothetical protein BR93DRAFT_888739 [Coniochaeta sp. PMI_546]|nr:hypothetical protein BR93DRAFT_888739 [Coniochaeta sp. PMI_546]